MDYVAYYRVSTTKQGKSGLGLEAQQKAVQDYVEAQGGQLIESFTEVQSGKDNNREQLHRALRKCRLSGATLLIAKLDRLSRNRSFLMELADSSTNFVAVDMPEANHFTVGLLACLADYERQLISERTTAALKAAKARGVKLGNPNLHLVRNNDTTAARLARSEKAKARNAEIREVIREIQDHSEAELSSRELAQALNNAGYKTARGKPWSHVAVLRVMAA